MENNFGFLEIDLTEEQVAQLYQNGPESVLKDYLTIENWYYLLKDPSGNVIEKYCYQDGIYRKVPFVALGGKYSGTVKPRNPQQAVAFDMLKDEASQIKVITGKFGTGKTLALVYAALELLEEGKFEKIYWIRNNVQVKDTDPLGALPGDAIDKMFPYLGPFMDHAGGVDGVREMLEKGSLEVLPLGFLRGRSLRHSIIISSEAENLTKEQIQLLIGRIDEGSNLWIDGDLKQRDNKKFETSAGLETLIDRLTGEPLFAHVHLIKTERSAVAALADKLD